MTASSVISNPTATSMARLSFDVSLATTACLCAAVADRQTDGVTNKLIKAFTKASETVNSRLMPEALLLLHAVSTKTSDTTRAVEISSRKTTGPTSITGAMR